MENQTTKPTYEELLEEKNELEKKLEEASDGWQHCLYKRRDLLKEYWRVRRALDKACKKIAVMDKDMAIIIHGPDTKDYASADEWKEWCLDENT